MFKVKRTLRATKPNPGIRAAYRKRIETLIEEMGTEVEAKVLELYEDMQWRVEDPDLATDGKWRSPSERFRDLLTPIAERWTARFKRLSETICVSFVAAIRGRVERGRVQSLKEAGIAVKINRSRFANERYQALIQENIDLIKTIPQEYFGRVNQQVQRNISKGYDKKALTEELYNDYDISYKRARVIARDQTQKATQSLAMVTDRDLGITEGVWIHVPGRYTSRPTHVAFDGKPFKLAEGLYDSNKYVEAFVKPGELPLCVPGSTKINATSFIEKIYRRWYDGKLSEVVTDDGAILLATPNHPVLTNMGWKPIGLLDKGDYIVKMGVEGVHIGKAEEDESVPTIQDIFDAFFFMGKSACVFAGSKAQFHGDGFDSDVYTIDAHRLLTGIGDAFFIEAATKFGFSRSEMTLITRLFSQSGHFQSEGFGAFSTPVEIMRGFGDRLPVFLRGLTHKERVSLLASAYMYACLNEPLSYNLSGTAELFGNSIFCLAGLIKGYDFFVRNITAHCGAASIARGNAHECSDLYGDIIRVVPDFSGNIIDVAPGRYFLSRVLDNRKRDFSGHVYNLQTRSGNYIAQNTVIHNCRCTYRPLLPDKWGKTTE